MCNCVNIIYVDIYYKILNGEFLRFFTIYLSKFVY